MPSLLRQNRDDVIAVIIQAETVTAHMMYGYLLRVCVHWVSQFCILGPQYKYMGSDLVTGLAVLKHDDVFSYTEYVYHTMIL